MKKFLNVLNPVHEFFVITGEILKNIAAGLPFLRYLKEIYSKRRIDLLNDIDRFFDVFYEFLNYYRKFENVDGKNILEIGYGNSLAIGLLFLAYGAKKVFLVDRFKHLFLDKENAVFHKKILNRIVEEEGTPFAQEAVKAVDIKNNGIIEFDKNKIEIIYANAANLPIEDDLIDLIISNAVLEHIHDIKKAVEEMSRVIKRGGICIHQVDLRDHFFKSQLLRLLQYPDWVWNLMTSNRPDYTNRLRISDYIKL